MEVHVLCEDKSTVPLVKAFLPKLIGKAKLSVFPHRGRGSLPKDWSLPPRQGASSLLDVLPAKLRAYQRLKSLGPDLLIVLLDSDRDDPQQLKAILETLFTSQGKDVPRVIGICVEETESWILGDTEAVLKAYPEADLSVLESYVQDAVCGTWELLAKFLYGQKAGSRLIDLGYQRVGLYKHEWARRIAAYMEPSSNRSPSCKAFMREIQDFLEGRLDQS